MVVASVRTLVRFRHQRLTLSVNDEREARVDTPLLFVGNNDYRIDTRRTGPAREPRGRRAVRAGDAQEDPRAALSRASMRALLGRARADDMGGSAGSSG